MAIGTALEQASFEELAHILSWLSDANANAERVPGVVVGGWAVYAYNPYYGSIDIDLVLSGKMRKSLSHWLIENRGFTIWHTEEVGWEAVRKEGPGGRWIIADFGSRSEHDYFEGRKDRLDFSEVDDHTAMRSIHGLDVLVPERALLVLFKLKAAWDRGHRLDNATSADPDWDQGKRTKDLADILALLDPVAGGEDLSVGYLGEKLATYPFLVDVLRESGRSGDSIDRYGRLPASKARAVVDHVIDLAT